MAVKNLTQEQINFIQDNKNKMKQKEIARLLGITPAAVCLRIKRPKVVTGFFDVDSFSKQYIA